MIQPSIIAGLSLSILSTIHAPKTTTICPENDQTICFQETYSESAVMASSYGEPFGTIELDQSQEFSAEPIGPEKPKKQYTSYFSADSSAHPLDSNRVTELINQVRADHDLSPLETSDELCRVANERAPELAEEIFGPKALHQGFKEKALPYWATENMIHQPTEEAALNWWMNSYIHQKAILSSSHTHTCGACQGNSCTQIFSSFVEKSS